jgi:hypothetical protein
MTRQQLPLNMFCRIVRARSHQNRRALELLHKEGLFGQVIAIFRQELDSLIRVIYLFLPEIHLLFKVFSIRNDIFTFLHRVYSFLYLSIERMRFSIIKSPALRQDRFHCCLVMLSSPAAPFSPSSADIQVLPAPASAKSPVSESVRTVRCARGRTAARWDRPARAGLPGRAILTF